MPPCATGMETLVRPWRLPRLTVADLGGVGVVRTTQNRLFQVSSIVDIAARRHAYRVVDHRLEAPARRPGHRDQVDVDVGPREKRAAVHVRHRHVESAIRPLIAPMLARRCCRSGRQGFRRLGTPDERSRGRRRPTAPGRCRCRSASRQPRDIAAIQFQSRADARPPHNDPASRARIWRAQVEIVQQHQRVRRVDTSAAEGSGFPGRSARATSAPLRRRPSGRPRPFVRLWLGDEHEKLVVPRPRPASASTTGNFRLPGLDLLRIGRWPEPGYAVLSSLRARHGPASR